MSPTDDKLNALNQDNGLGYCLQCTGEWKASNYTKPFPKFACVLAPCPMGIIAVCIDHLVTDAPQIPGQMQMPGMPTQQIQIPELRRRRG